jgi:hypothetical protein
MKIAPLIGEMARFPEICAVLVHTEQHYDEAMSALLSQDLYMRRPPLLLFCCHGPSGRAYGLWTRAVCHAEKMQDHPLCVSRRSFLALYG